MPPNKKHEEPLKIKGLNTPRALPRICFAYAHSARSAFGTLYHLQARKANEKTTHSGGSFVGVIGQNYNSLSCIFSISLAHSTAAWNFSVSRTELNHAHLGLVKRSQIVEM